MLITGDSVYEGDAWHVYLGGRKVGQYSLGRGVEHIHTDQLGSAVATSSNAGLQAWTRKRYEPYGAPRPGSEVPVSSGYTGHAHDPETALVQMQQRYYEPLAGRFLSVDPVVTDTTAGGGFNRYVYATSNPYRFVDPTGMSPEESSCSTSGASICHSHQIADTSSAGPTAASLIRATASVVTGGYSDQATEAAASGDALAATVYTIAGTAVAVVNGATLGNGSRILEVFGLAKGLRQR